MSHKRPPIPLHLPTFTMHLKCINVSPAIIHRACYHQSKLHQLYRLIYRVSKVNIISVISIENVSTNKAQPLQQVTPGKILRVNPPEDGATYHTKNDKESK